MIFYCPNCRTERETDATSTIVTQSGRTAYKASCPVCGQDMAEFLPETNPEATGQNPNNK